MSIQSHHPVQDALNLAAILTEACSRTGTAGYAVKHMQDALRTQPEDPRVVRLAELFTSEMVGNKSPVLQAEIDALVIELGATPV